MMLKTITILLLDICCLFFGGEAGAVTGRSAITASSDEHISALPAHFLPGLTATLVVNCTLPPTANFSNVISLIVSHAPAGSATFTEIASIVSTAPDTVQEPDPSLGAKIDGHMSPGGGAYLTLTWDYPPAEAAGQFACEGFGTDTHGHPKLSRSEVEVVKEEDVTPTVLVGEIRTLTSRLTSLEQFRGDVTARLTDAMAAVFVAEESFQGHNYRLSRPMLRDISMHDHLCRLFGGYLVELESQAEYKFLEQFALVRHGVKKLAIGVSDRDHEKTFTFIKSGRPATTYKRGDGLNGDGDCVELWSIPPYNDGYVDEPCWGPAHGGDTANHFVCEFNN